jgi:hypothetical protein
MKSAISSSAFALSASFFLLTSGAALADTKVYQADSVCRGTLIPSLSSGTMPNNSSVTAAFIYCAINRDRTDLKPLSVHVTVIDNSSLLIGDGNFSCNLLPVSRTGILGAAGGTVVTAGTNSAGQILVVPIPAVVPVDGTLTLKCKVPRKGVGDTASVLASIKVIEPDPTN